VNGDASVWAVDGESWQAVTDESPVTTVWRAPATLECAGSRSKKLDNPVQASTSGSPSTRPADDDVAGAEPAEALGAQQSRECRRWQHASSAIRFDLG